MTRRHYKGKFSISEKPNICANCKKEWYTILTQMAKQYVIFVDM